jgi:hypothetical protein
MKINSALIVAELRGFNSACLRRDRVHNTHQEYDPAQESYNTGVRDVLELIEHLEDSNGNAATIARVITQRCLNNIRTYLSPLSKIRDDAEDEAKSIARKRKLARKKKLQQPKEPPQ